MKQRKNSLEERSPAFTFGSGKQGRTLFCDQLPAEQLARRYGTPLFVYSATALRRHVDLFARAFAAQQHTVCYSVKANSNLSLLRLLASLGCGFDVVSGGELQRVMQAGEKAAASAVFSGVGKTAAEMDLAIAAGILLFNLESASELDLLAQRAARLKKTARVSFRVNPDVKADTHPYISTGLRQHKFGVPINEAREFYRRAAALPYLDPIGVSVHIGSQITDTTPFAEAMQRVLSLVRDLSADGLNISFVDAGGGLGIHYQNASQAVTARDIRAYAKALCRPLRRTGLHLLIEPGRSIVAAAGVLLTRALYAKENHGKQFLIVDAAMNDLIRPALYGAHHEIVPATPRPATKDAPAMKMDIVGPICESGDFFARDREMPPVLGGDLLAILDSGAYGMSLSSNYNTRPRAAELLVDGKKVKQIRRRETFEDMIRNEQ
ncbi:MAG: diaminopimelate decarboxylase [Acidobacteriota bacterium]|nr:diaminopimelate decarboxylase [Acidobacteriota bacterium]